MKNTSSHFVSSYAPLVMLVVGTFAATEFSEASEILDDARMSALVELIRPETSDQLMQTVYRELSSAGEQAKSHIPQLAAILKNGRIMRVIPGHQRFVETDRGRQLYTEKDTKRFLSDRLSSLHCALRLLIALKADDPELQLAVIELLKEISQLHAYDRYLPVAAAAAAREVPNQDKGVSRATAFYCDLLLATSVFNDGKGSAIPVLLELFQIPHVDPVAERARALEREKEWERGIIRPQPAFGYGHRQGGLNLKITESIRVFTLEMLGKQGVNSRELRASLHRLSLTESNEQIRKAVIDCLKVISRFPEVASLGNAGEIIAAEPNHSTPMEEPRPSPQLSSEQVEQRIAAIDNQIGSLQETIVKLRAELAEARSGNRLSSVALFQATISEYQQLIADLKRERGTLKGK